MANSVFNAYFLKNSTALKNFLKTNSAAVVHSYRLYRSLSKTRAFRKQLNDQTFKLCHCHHASLSSWSYSGETGPEYWLAKFSGSNVSGNMQSPIDIDSKDAVFAPVLKSDAWRTWEHGIHPDSLINTGRSAQVQLTGRHWVSGAGLPSLYQAVQYHFHWGETDEIGSEHTIDGRPYSLELHVVCFDAVRYASFSEAADKPNGLAVVAVMYEIGEENVQLAKILPHLRAVCAKAEASVEFESPLISELLPDERDKYFRYGGSLTTPPLYESVVWSVLQAPLTVSRSQLAEFRTLQQPDGCGCIFHNFRPVQPLGERCVHKSFE